MKTYILIQTENKNATFLSKGEEILYFEILQISNLIAGDENNNGKIIVSAPNQQEALKKFRMKFPNLLKRASKDYYEAELIL